MSFRLIFAAAVVMSFLAIVGPAEVTAWASTLQERVK